MQAPSNACKSTYIIMICLTRLTEFALRFNDILLSYTLMSFIIILTTVAIHIFMNIRPTGIIKKVIVIWEDGIAIEWG